MVVLRSGRLVAWTRAWQAGRVAYDDVLAHTTGGDEPHLVGGLPDVDGEQPLGRALVELHAAEPRLVLPVPGDPRGLPGPGPFTDAAIDAGEGVLAGALGLVPGVTRHGSAVGSATFSVRWQAFALPGAAPSPLDPLAVAEAEHALSDALRETATALASLDVARWRPELADALAELRRPTPGPGLPPGYPPRAQRLLAQADRLDRVLALAHEDAPGGAVSGYEARERDAALRGLSVAVRRARVAAYNADLDTG